ncbi:glycosyltransferase family 2 protein [Candidatus Microgenomates bacterium]|nr:glycosyltransferase family 2 protein [Candidatus Microgenomates bacterium]
MNKRKTLTIGIPAYNEEGNIAVLLKSLLKQKQQSFSIEKILVVCDGCTDGTVDEIKKVANNNSMVSYRANNKRNGKAEALNMIHREFKTDYLLTMDADLCFLNKDALEEMVKTLESKKKLVLVSPLMVPLPPETWMGRFSYVSFCSFQDAFLKINSGNNFYSSTGCNLMRRDFGKKLNYPAGTISDQCFIYAMATKKDPYAFAVAQKSRLLFRSVQTFHDWRLLGIRAVLADKENAVSFFGSDILKRYSMPKKLYLISLAKWFFRDPLATAGCIAMNLFIRKFPYKKALKNGLWETTMSSKKHIAI